jgi:NodT family efflux transporter outer membrane factor (OMF) lipoprotein
MPKATVATQGAGNPGKAQYFIAGRDIPGEWWELFHSPQINALIDKGIVNNPNLAAAQAALRQAQEALNVQIGNLLFPAVNASVSGERARFSSLSFGATGPSTVLDVYNAGASVSYLVDVFGGSRRQVESYRAQVDYARYQLIATYLTLTSNIVTTAVTVASLQAQVDATRDLIRESENQLAIVKKQYHLGGASLQNVFTQQTQVSVTRALLPPLETSLAQSRHALAVLVGDLPSNSQLPPLTLDAFNLPAEIPIGIPSLLVRQRPDVQAAEAQLHSASAQIGVTTAALLPQLTLNGAYGWTAQTPSGLFNSINKVWSFGANISQPLFHGGALLAQRRQAIAAFQQSQALYKQAVLQAFKNVADSLRALENDAREFKAQKEAEVSALSTYVLTKKQYRLGGVSYLTLLTAEQQYQQARVNRIKAQAARYADSAALFAALGGGWWNKPQVTFTNPDCKQKETTK